MIYTLAHPPLSFSILLGEWNVGMAAAEYGVKFDNYRQNSTKSFFSNNITGPATAIISMLCRYPEQSVSVLNALPSSSFLEK